MSVLLALFESSFFSLDGKVTLGSIVEITVLLLGFATSWYKVKLKSAEHDGDIKDVTETVEKHTEQLQLLALTTERLTTLSEVNEKRWERLDRFKSEL